jgi:site-specific DNA-methyltransferase (adenine-specific)
LTESPHPLPCLHSDETLHLHHGDVLAVLASLPEASVDMMFADPPYNLSNNGFTCHAGKRVSVNKGAWDKSHGIEADFQFHRAWINACHRVLKPNGTLWVSGTYHSIYACGFALQLEGWHVINDVAWFKPNAAPNLSCRMFTASHETLIWAKKQKTAKHTFNYELIKYGQWHEDDFIKKPEKQMRSVWACGTPKPGEKQFGKHPTQKPELLLRRIVVASSQVGDVVCDPFCGSGTTGVVALQHGRRFIGIDQNLDYLETLALRRLLRVQRFKESRQLFLLEDGIRNL